MPTNECKAAAKMGSQRYRLQMKGLQKPPGKELNETEAGNLSDTEFKGMVIGMLNSMKKDTETIKKDQSEMKNRVSEINNTLGGRNGRLDEAEDQISNLEAHGEKKKPPDQSSKKKK